VSGLIRFGVSLEKKLLERFDKLLTERKYSNRSEAIRDLIRDMLVEEEWKETSREVSGIISLVYDHHKRELVNLLMKIQHDHSHMIISAQHIHLDHDNCLEVIVAKGRAKEVGSLAQRLRSTKGVKHGGVIMTTAGKGL
jgi:CopG family nickel-responsive transcriptional regulator